MSLRNERTGLVVAATLEPAFDSASRKRGLLGRDGLAAGHALIIAPSNMVHTFFMRFPIDILIVSRGGRGAEGGRERAGAAHRRRAGADLRWWRCAAGSLAASETRRGRPAVAGRSTAAAASAAKVSS